MAVNSQDKIGFRIVSPHFVAGGEIKDGKVIRCAPILNNKKFSILGWTLLQLKQYCDKMKWDIERLST